MRRHDRDAAARSASGAGPTSCWRTAPAWRDSPCARRSTTSRSCSTSSTSTRRSGATWRAASTPPLSWIYRREAATLGAFEARAARRAVTALVVNEREAGIASALAPGANVQVLANGVELDRLQPLDAAIAGAAGRVLRRDELRAE